MCEQCNQIDIKIARYRRLANGAADKPMIEHLRAFIAGLEAERGRLHPEPPEPTAQGRRLFAANESRSSDATFVTLG